MKKVIVQLHDGQVSLVEQPEDVEVEVRDYDVPEDWEGDIPVDSEGDRYQRHVFPAKDIDIPVKQIRTLSEDEADDISDKGKLRGKSYSEKMNILYYELDGKFYEIYITPDSSAWVFGGEELDSDKDFPQ